MSHYSKQFWLDIDDIQLTVTDSNPLLMGYEGGDLLLTGVAWPTVGSLPRPVCAGYGRWPRWLAAPVSDVSALEVAGPQDALHKSTTYLFAFYRHVHKLRVKLTK